LTVSSPRGGAPYQALDPDQVADVQQPHSGQPFGTEQIAVEKIWILPEASCRSYEPWRCCASPGCGPRRGPDPRFRHPRRGRRIFVRARPPRACVRNVGIRVDPERPETIALADPHGAQGILYVSRRALVICHGHLSRPSEKCPVRDKIPGFSRSNGNFRRFTHKTAIRPRKRRAESRPCEPIPVAALTGICTGLIGN